MAGKTRGLLFASLLGVLALLLIASFSSSNFSLTLVLGSLFATVVGTGFLLRSGNPVGQSSSLHLKTSHHANGDSSFNEHASLPDPLAMDMDMPL